MISDAPGGDITADERRVLADAIRHELIDVPAYRAPTTSGHEWVHGPGQGSSDGQRSRGQPCTRRPEVRVLLAASAHLAAVELHAAQRRWGRHERWGWVCRRQSAAEVVAE